MTASNALRCPACGEPILRTDNECMSCGAFLDEGQLAGSPTGAATAAPATPAPPVAGAAADDLEITLEPVYHTPPPAAAPPPAAPRPVPAPTATPAAVPYRVSPQFDRTYSVYDVPQGGGFGATLSRAWTFLTESLRLARAHPVVMAPSLISMGASVLLIGVYVLVMYALGLFKHPDQEEQVTARLAMEWLGVGFGLLGALLTYWFMGMTADLVSAVLRGDRPSLGHAWNEAARNAMALLWLAVVTTIVRAITSQLRRRGGVLGDMAADAAEKAWEVATYLLVPIIILEDISFSDATQRALRLHRGNVIGIVVGEIAVSWLTSLAVMLLLFPVVVACYLAAQALPVLIPIWIALGVGWLLMLSAGAGYVRMAYYTCLYEWAAATEAASEPVPAPAPLAAALARN